MSKAPNDFCDMLKSSKICLWHESIGAWAVEHPHQYTWCALPPYFLIMMQLHFQTFGLVWIQIVRFGRYISSCKLHTYCFCWWCWNTGTGRLDSLLDDKLHIGLVHCFHSKILFRWSNSVRAVRQSFSLFDGAIKLHARLIWSDAGASYAAPNRTEKTG